MATNLENNGLKKTVRGQMEQAQSNLDTATVGKSIRGGVIPNCLVLSVSGVYSFGNFNYLPIDKGSILVDLKLPNEEYLFENGIKTNIARNVRIRMDENQICSDIGMLKENLLNDEYGNPRFGDLYFKSRNSNDVSLNGEFVYKKPTKGFGTMNGMNNEKASMYGEKISPTFNVLQGSLDSQAVTKYRELYINDIKNGDYYG